MTRFSVLIGIVVCLVSVLLGQNASTDKGLGNREKLLVAYERTTCYGTCPSFLVSIYNDGRVTYEGRKFVKVSGKAEFNLNGEKFQQLQAAIDAAKFHSIRLSFVEVGCTSLMTDDYWVYITVPGKMKVKRVTHYLGCHGGNSRFRTELRRLVAFEKAIERVLEIERWIGTEEERSKFQPRPEIVKN
ncbi:MAG: DUF6438 domain-containing protein [bacterium]|nr:DUF6438 domain-containing protein [bacterium]